MTTGIDQLRARASRQRRWIADHGGDLLGYIARYGSVAEASRYGDGGEAIYAADLARLAALDDQVARLAGMRRGGIQKGVNG